MYRFQVTVSTILTRFYLIVQSICCI